MSNNYESQRGLSSMFQGLFSKTAVPPSPASPDVQQRVQQQQNSGFVVLNQPYEKSTLPPSFSVHDSNNYSNFQNSTLPPSFTSNYDNTYNSTIPPYGSNQGSFNNSVLPPYARQDYFNYDSSNQWNNQPQQYSAQPMMSQATSVPVQSTEPQPAPTVQTQTSQPQTSQAQTGTAQPSAPPMNEEIKPSASTTTTSTVTPVTSASNGDTSRSSSIPAPIIGMQAPSLTPIDMIPPPMETDASSSIPAPPPPPPMFESKPLKIKTQTEGVKKQEISQAKPSASADMLEEIKNGRSTLKKMDPTKITKSNSFSSDKAKGGDNLLTSLSFALDARFANIRKSQEEEDQIADEEFTERSIKSSGIKSSPKIVKSY